MMHRNQLWEDLGKTTAVRRAAGSNKSLSHEEAEHIQATDSDWVLSWESYHNLPWGQGWRNTGGRLIFLECLPDPWNSTYMISYHPQDQKGRSPFYRHVENEAQGGGGAEARSGWPHPSSSSHATMSPCTSCLPDTVEKWKRAQRRLILGKSSQNHRDGQTKGCWNFEHEWAEPISLLLPSAIPQHTNGTQTSPSNAFSECFCEDWVWKETWLCELSCR